MMKKYLLFSLCGLALVLGIVILTIFIIREDFFESKTLSLYGNVDIRQVDISFRVSGKVIKLYVQEGDFVKEGTLLAELDSSPYDHELKQAYAKRLSALADYNNSKRLFERRHTLVGIGGVSKEDLESSETQYEVLKANFEAAEAQLQTAIDNVNYTKVYAPTDGIILSRIREPGSVVNSSQPIYTLSISSPVWIRTYVSEPNLGKICYGMKAYVTTDTKDLGPFTGKIGFISPQSEFTPKSVETTQLRTDLVYRLRVYIDDPTCYLKQGMPVTIKIPLEDCDAEKNTSH
jgi:HlyD family secretion protein